MTPHFSAAELACKCGCGMLPALDAVERLERVRVKVGFPLKVTSGARCAFYNQQVARTGDGGPHTTGRAFDLAVRGAQAYATVAAALAEGFTGIGVSQKGESRFLHIDDLPASATRPRPTIWSY